MGYYGSDVPERDDIVFVKIQEYSKNGAYCNLIEYDDKESFVINTELDRKISDAKKLLKMDKIYPMVVLSTSDNMINLSYMKVKKDDREKLVKYFAFYAKIFKIMEELAYFTKIDNKEIQKLILWNILKKSELKYSEETYNNLLMNPDTITDYISEKYSVEAKNFLENIKNRITHTDLLEQQEFSLMIYEENAIELLKDILLNTSQKITHISSPKYAINVTGENKYVCEKKIQDCVEEIKNKLKDKKHILKLEDIKVTQECVYTLKPLNMTN